jgi:hypothetical protein
LLLAFFAPVPVLADPPDAHDDEYDNIWEDSFYYQNHLDVLANDEPLPGRPFEIVGVTQGTHDGIVAIGPGGTFVTYQPVRNFDGTEEFTYYVDDGSGLTLSATVRVIIRGINDPPIAEDDTASTNEDTLVVIDVLENDDDIDGDIDPTSVTRISGPSHGEANVDPASGLITYAPDKDWSGQDTFTYRVWDDGSPGAPRYAQANVYVTVRPVSDPPVADAGPDQSVPTLSTVTLDGSGSYDPDGQIELGYLWQQTGGSQQVDLSDPTAQSPTFVAPDDPDVLVFSLRVFDQGQVSANTDYVRITVTNQTPVADAGPDLRVRVEELATLDGSGSYDPDNDELTFEWAQTGGPRVSLSSITAEMPTFTAPAAPANLTFELRVRDAFGARSLPSQTRIEVYELPTFSLYLPFVVFNQATMPDLVVKTLTATKNNIQVVIENQGSAAVTQGFYVDVYVKPQRAPIQANEGWFEVGSEQGLVWGIEIAQQPKPAQGIIAPLMPGESLTLNYGDAFYYPLYSSFAPPLVGGKPVYAQVDSYPAASPHNGLVLETHEYYGQAYNNITGPVFSTGAASSTTTPLSVANKHAPPAGLRPKP